MKKTLLSLLIISLLSACVHRMNIEQGNLFNQADIARIHRGMSPAQVKEIMGNPVLVNTFADNRMDYVYTMQLGHQPRTEKSVIFIFSRNSLKDIKVEIQ